MIPFYRYILLESDEITDYRGEHTAPDTDSASAYDLTMNGVYPEDVYIHPDWYESGDGLNEMYKIQRLRGKPDAFVWIHRALPPEAVEDGKRGHGAFKRGDWVTTNKDYAKGHGESALNGNYVIVSARVKSRYIFTNGDSIFEWGYWPEAM